MRKRKFGRPISGVLLLDKPKGETSNHALQTVKELFFAQKAGHTGSLDPLATGLLPVCFGEATKFSQYLLNADKRYTVTCQLGVTTDSGDADGRILEQKPVGLISKSAVKKILKSYLGKSMQTPPMHSAIKIKGEPLYKKALRGEAIEREAREITIFEYELLGMTGDILTLEVHCSKGTYVRTLVEDLGAQLGCGAHVIDLRRTVVGKFRAEEMIDMVALKTLHQADDKFKSLNDRLLPVGEMARSFPRVALGPDQKFYLCQGQAIRVNNSPESGLVSLYFKDIFIGVAAVLEDGRLEPKRLINTKS